MVVRLRSFTLIAVAAGGWFGPTSVLGQEESGGDGEVRIEFGGRLHTQLATSSAADGKSIDFFTRRARFTVDIRVSPLLDARVQPEFGGGRLDLKDAYFRLNFDPALRLSTGQFKRAFDIFELDSSTDIVVVERTGRIDGAVGCGGPGGTCSLSRFNQKLAHSGRDVGVKVDGAVGGRFRYMATLTNGTGAVGADENSGKSLAGRVSVRLTERIWIAGNVSRHDYVGHEGGTAVATAFGGDLEIGDFREGTHLQVGAAGGGNWRLQDHPAGEAPRFLAVQAILSRYFPTEGRSWEGVEPVLRAGWGDPNRVDEADDGLLVTPGVFLYVRGKNRIGVNLDVYLPGSGGTEYSFKVQTYLHY